MTASALVPRLLLTATVLALGACAGTNNRDDGNIASTEAVQPTTASISPLELVRQADGINAMNATPLLLQAAAMFLDQGDQQGATNALNQINPMVLSPLQATDFNLLRAEIALVRNTPNEALALLEPTALPDLALVPREKQIRVYELRSEVLAVSGAVLNSALERIAMDPLLDQESQRSNHDAIWHALTGLPQDQIQALNASTNDTVIRGWYDLALIAQSYSTDMDRQLVELQRWRGNWATHPAALILPPQMELIETLARERPNRIALLLPLNNSAGSLVRDAFMSAYFSLQELGGQVPAIRIYDTSDINDIRPLHQRAREEGAELIVGPLLKQHVAQLQNEPDLGVPTLALNNNEGQTPASPLLYQFALSPEDEARQLAIKAWRDGKRRAAILSPGAESTTDTANRKRDSFRAEWEALGGLVVAVDTYDENYTDSISEMLLLNESSRRQQQLNQLLGRAVVAELRRRQDLDFIYLVAQPEAARQIVPSLAYLYAGDIPIYASQDLYAGNARQTDDKDLNGVIFGESPWLLNVKTDVDRVRQLFPAGAASSMRLQAFGIDAFRLYPRLRLLESATGASIPGISGRLKLGANRNIVRELTWTTITDGLIRPLP